MLRAWLEKFSLALLQLGFINSNYDSVLFNYTPSCGKILLLLYVDNMIITRGDLDGITFLKDHLAKLFEIKDFGLLSFFLGIEITS